MHCLCFAGCIHSCPDELQSFMKILSSKSPLCAAFPYSDIGVVEDIIKEDGIVSDTVVLKRIQESMPIFFDLILLHSRSLPKFLQPVLTETVKIVRKTFDYGDHMSTSMTSNGNLFSYFPNLPIIRDRGCYVMDKAKSERQCMKQGGRHPSLLPGIFTVFCPHGEYIYYTL